MTRRSTQRVVFQPDVYHGFQKGVNLMVNAVRPTLGPRPRTVAVERQPNSQTPEIFDDGGLITRRIIELPDRDQDMGAMFIRHLLWRQHERVGDGTATTAVLFQAIYNEGVRYITAGGNAMQLRRYLEKGLPVILDTLTGMTLHLDGREKLTQVAEAICHDPPLSKMLGEIFDIIGAYGQLDIRSGRSREMEREYVEGMYWKNGVVSRRMMDAKQGRVDLENAAILISNVEISDPRQLALLLDMAFKAEMRKLLIIASRLSDEAISVLLTASQDPAKLQAIAVKTPGVSINEQVGALEDLAVLTGGRPLIRAAGDTLVGATPQHLGRARRVWADAHHFGVLGGRGNPRTLRAHIATLRAAFKGADDPEVREATQKRIGKLVGGSATLWVGGATDIEIKTRKAHAERTAKVLRGAIMEGVLPGGGVSLLSCRPALQQMLDGSQDEDERAAYRILIRAMEAPARTIFANAGCDASEVMAEIKLTGNPGYGLDVRSGNVVEMAQAGIFDVTAVQKASVHGAISGAALALTTDVLVHHKKPQTVYTP